MTATPVFRLPHRAVIRVAGSDAASFLHGLVTNSVDEMAAGSAKFAGLLSPQGKILFDFFAVRTAEEFFLDCPAETLPALVKRLTLYKLRAQVSIEDASSTWAVGVSLDVTAAPSLEGGAVFADPRHEGLGFRLIASLATLNDAPDGTAAYTTARIALGIPEGGADYPYGDTFPHEACYDLLHGVDFRKGCYVGQEVVSRMQHRATTRKRIVCVYADAPLPANTEIKAADFTIGTLGSADETRGIGLVRLDRAAEAERDGVPLHAGDIPVRLSVPPWASYRIESLRAGAAE